MEDDKILKRYDQLKSIGLKLLPEVRLCMGYENEEKHIYINFDHTDIRFYEDDKWNQAFEKAKKLMETVNGNSAKNQKA
jgi:hypothetical protein